MELSLSAQAVSLGLFAALGLALGLLYDLLRPLRYSGFGGLLWDIVFCVAAGAGCFVLSMISTRPGIWDMGSACLGFCIYINFLSPLFLPRLLDFFSFIFRIGSLFLAKTKKFITFAKKSFTNEPD